MRRPRLFWRIYATYLVVIVLCAAAVGFYAVRSGRSFYMNHTETELQARAGLVRLQITPLATSDKSAELENLVSQLGQASDTRITVISGGIPGAALGVVLADSQAVPAEMENHANRPEVRKALQSGMGVAVRHSATLDEQMMYVALPLVENGRVAAIVRVAVPLTKVNQALRSLYVQIGVSALIIALVAAGIGLLVSARISRQMREIKTGAQRLAGGDFSHKILVPATEEFAAVAESLNQMAEELDEKIATLTHERNQREAVLSSMVEGVIAVDTEDRVIAVNEAAAGFIETEPAAAEGKTIQEVLRNPDLQRLVAETLDGREPVEVDIMVHAGNEERFLQANATLLRGAADDVPVGAVVVLNDVTRLQRLEVVRRDFVANVSHELKTPVTSIKGFAETLEDGALDDPEAARRFVRIIAGQADRLNSIIGDLLALSSLEQRDGDSRLSLEEADVRDVITAAVHICQVRANPRNTKIVVNSPEAVLAAVNPPLLEQAVINLVDNAVKYSPDGSTVEVGLEQKGGEILITVRDRGAGIPREHLSRLFERFYRVDKARSRDLGGTGLGLAIVKHIVQAHGGSVAVQSVVGRGSTFSVHLPHS
jgi:two-component system phosphate regulon sensor histidine kinase PhoR